MTQETRGNSSAIQFSPTTPVTAAVGILGDAANTVVYFGIIAIPTYFGILGVLLASRKLLLPMMKRAAKA